MPSRHAFTTAAKVLADRDPVIARLVRLAGLPHTSRSRETPFAALLGRELESLGDPFRPYRSAVAWYCWRAAELLAPATSVRSAG